MDYQKHLAVIERNAWGATAANLAGELFLVFAAWACWSNLIPLPQALSWARLLLVGYFAVTAVGGMISLIFSVVICSTRFSQAGELLQKRRHTGELLVTTIPMPFFFGATVCVTVRTDETGKPIKDSERLSTALASKADLKDALPLLMKNNMSLMPSSPMTSINDDSGNMRLLLGNNVVYLLLMTYPAPFAKLLPLLATRKSSS